MSEEKLDSYVSPGDIFTAVKTLYGQHASVLDYDVKRATTSVQGFTSLMLRVTATVKVNEKTTETASLIIKRLPILQTQLDMFSSQMDVFDKEITFFRKAVPILKAINPNVPVVNCLHAYGTTMVMEDLCKSGFTTIAESMEHVIEHDIIDISHARIAMRKLAQFHAASVDINWQDVLGKFIEVDSMFEGPGSETIRKTFIMGAKAIAIIIKELYPEKGIKYSEWFNNGSDFYDYLGSHCKPSKSKLITVLCHGDFWLNNMMFKLDPITNKPLDVKLIDLQIYRYASPVTDILYFLYMITNKKFRDTNEKEILKTYVDAFNTMLCETPDRITYETMHEEYENLRFYGIGLALVFRTMLLLGTIFPKDGETLSTEHFENMLYRDNTQEIVSKYYNDEAFRNEMTSIINEAIIVLERTKAV